MLLRQQSNAHCWMMAETFQVLLHNVCFYSLLWKKKPWWGKKNSIYSILEALHQISHCQGGDADN